MKELNDIIIYVLSASIGIITFFLKLFHNQVTSNSEEVTILKAEIRLLKQEIESLEGKTASKIDNLIEISNLKFNQISDRVKENNDLLAQILNKLNL